MLLDIDGAGKSNPPGYCAERDLYQLVILIHERVDLQV